MRGLHKLEIVTAQSGDITLDAFSVSASGEREFPGLYVGGLGIVLIGALSLFARSLWGARKSRKEKTGGAHATD
jgi:hypothetical protein